MKAIVYEEFGSPDVLELKEVEKAIPKSIEMLLEMLVNWLTYCSVKTFSEKKFLIVFFPL